MQEAWEQSNRLGAAARPGINKCLSFVSASHDSKVVWTLLSQGQQPSGNKCTPTLLLISGPAFSGRFGALSPMQALCYGDPPDCCMGKTEATHGLSCWKQDATSIPSWKANQGSWHLLAGFFPTAFHPSTTSFLPKDNFWCRSCWDLGEWILPGRLSKYSDLSCLFGAFGVYTHHRQK